MTDAAWRWIGEALVLAIHDAQIAEHGGAAGVRDLAMVHAALGQPQNLAAYGTPDLAALAAAYAFGLARNHGFVDGNKRTAFVVATVFLLDHGYELAAEDTACVRVMLALAAGEMDEAGMADWFSGAMRMVEV